VLDVRPGSLLLCLEIVGLLLIHLLHMFDSFRGGRGSLLALEGDRHCLLRALLLQLDLRLRRWLLVFSLLLRRGWDRVHHVHHETDDRGYEEEEEREHE